MHHFFSVHRTAFPGNIHQNEDTLKYGHDKLLSAACLPQTTHAFIIKFISTNKSSYPENCLFRLPQACEPITQSNKAPLSNNKRITNKSPVLCFETTARVNPFTEATAPHQVAHTFAYEYFNYIEPS